VAWTLADILQYIQDNDHANTSTRGARQHKKIANDANLALHSAGDWDFDRTMHRVVLAAEKAGGTLSLAVDAAAITGVGTDFQAADVGSYFRFAGEAQQYRLLTRTTALACTCETYRGAANLSGAAYSLTQDRVALPARFRAFEVADDGLIGPLDVCDLAELQYDRLHRRETGIPNRCAYEETSDPTAVAGAAPTPYLWVYPSPTSKTVLDLPVYLWPAEMTDNAHGIGAPARAERSYREFVLAYLYREQGDYQKFQAQVQVAVSMARADLGQRARRVWGQKRMWNPDEDGKRSRSRVVHITDVRG
jgi:hypothetical protein